MNMFCLNDYEKYAKKHLDLKAWAFYSQGAERELTLRENLRSYTRYTLIPRMLLNNPIRDLSTTILGHKISLPIGVAPTAFQRLAHSDGEIASSKAAEEIGAVFTLSTFATTALEDVANSVPNRLSPLFMQIYLFKSRSASEELIRRAEVNGYKALVLTVDSPVIGLQLKRMRLGGLEVPSHFRIHNLMNILEKVGISNQVVPQVKEQDYLIKMDISWDDVAWVRSVTSLPLVLKGIITGEDAKKAVEYGASAIWVSNHGGRQLDGISTPIDVLPEIVYAVKGSGVEIYADGGVRWGSDVLKALALGAKVVFIGRPVLWGLVHSGQDGVRNVLVILKSELDRAMHLAAIGAERLAKF